MPKPGLLTALSVLVLIGRPDVSDTAYRDLASAPELAPLVRIVPLRGGSGSGTLLPGGRVLTAAHVVARLRADSLRVLVAGEPFRVREVLVHPGWATADRVDLAMIVLEAVPGHPVARLVESPPTLPVHVRVAGFGLGGTTRTDSAGQARAGENILEVRGGLRPGVTDSAVLVGDFDLPGLGRFNASGDSLPLALEALPTGGDSGGPVFVRVRSEWRLLGVYSATAYNFDHWTGGQPSYAGSRFAVTDLTAFRDWLATAAPGSLPPSSRP